MVYVSMWMTVEEYWSNFEC